MQGSMYMECHILNGKLNIKNNYRIKFTCFIELLPSIFELFVFLIIGRNSPKIYNRIIAKDTISIALTALIFITIIFPLNVEIIQQNYMVCD
jgi:hypothetical protein